MKGRKMELTVKKFDELTTRELYEILKARADVFVVEQSCIYNDLDGNDSSAFHVFLHDGDGIAAYLRVVEAGVYGDSVRIGRVITTRRGLGLGSQIMQAGLAVARDRLAAHSVTISAQTHAIGFYEKNGFTVTSSEYFEDGIPHVKMVCAL